MVLHKNTTTTMTTSNCSYGGCSNTSLSEEEEIALRYAANDAKAIQYIPVMVYVAILMVVGVVGNTLVLYVYRRRFKRTSSNYFILTMAIFDLIGCVIGMPTEIYDLRFPYAFYSSAACKVLRFSEAFTIYGSTVILVAIAVDRYMKICHPLRDVSLLKIKIQCFMATIIGLCLAGPTCILFGITRTEIPRTSITGYDCSIEDKYSKSTFQTVYYGCVMLVFIGTFFTLAVLYIKIWLEIRRRKQMVIGDQITKPLDEKKGDIVKKKVKVTYVPSTSDDDSTNNNNNSGPTSPGIKAMRSRFASLSSVAAKINVSRTTLILFAVTVAFLISYLPAIVVMIIRSVVKDIEQTQSAAAEVTSKLFSKFFFVNNAINPIIYSFLNVNFRRQAKTALKRILCCAKRKTHFAIVKRESDKSNESKGSRTSKKTVDTVL